MRISDWSSDVCSSDLSTRFQLRDDTARRLQQPVGECLRVHRGTVLPSHCDGDVLLPEPLAAFVLPAQHAGDDVTRAVERNRPRDAFEIVVPRSEEHTSELQSLMRNTYPALYLTNKNIQH